MFSLKTKGNIKKIVILQEVKKLHRKSETIFDTFSYPIHNWWHFGRCKSLSIYFVKKEKRGIILEMRI